MTESFIFCWKNVHIYGIGTSYKNVMEKKKEKNFFIKTFKGNYDQ